MYILRCLYIYFNIITWQQTQIQQKNSVKIDFGCLIYLFEITHAKNICIKLWPYLNVVLHGKDNGTNNCQFFVKCFLLRALRPPIFFCSTPSKGQAGGFSSLHSEIFYYRIVNSFLLYEKHFFTIKNVFFQECFSIT